MQKSLTEQIKDLMAQLAAEQGKVVTLTADVTKLTGEHALALKTIQDSLTTSQASVTKLTEDLRLEKENSAKVCTALDTAKADLTKANAELAQAKMTLGTPHFKIAQVDGQKQPVTDGGQGSEQPPAPVTENPYPLFAKYQTLEPSERSTYWKANEAGLKAELCKMQEAEEK